MLKLLKVVLLDSKEDRHCASPADFASSLLKAKGLQVLLYLTSNSSFDVKSMCLKLIDVLSSHTSLIKIAIDPDVITYLSNIILPKQMVDAAATLNRKNNQLFNNLPQEEPLFSENQLLAGQQQYAILENPDEDMAEEHKKNPELEDS